MTRGSIDSTALRSDPCQSGGALQQPWSFIPTMALFQSLVFCAVSILPGLFLKSSGASNELVGLASIFALPIAFRFLAGIAVDRRGSMRAWSITTQALSAATAVAGALSMLAGAHLWVTLSLFALAGLIAAFQDVSTDGVFLFAIRERKAFYCSLKLQIYRIGILIGQGLYVMLAGWFIKDHLAPSDAWGRVFLLHAAVLAALLFWNVLSFPTTARGESHSQRETTTFRWFFRAIADFVRTPGMGWVLAFIALFRAAESVVTAMKAPFLLDPVAKGGLGLSLQDVGFLNGVLVFGISILGGIAGGIWVQRMGLRRTLAPAVLLMNLPNAVFFYLAQHPPQAGSTALGLSVSWEVVLCLVAEGVANSVALAPLVYLLVICAQGPHRATLFAFASGVMNLGWTLPGTMSGYLQKAMGYPALFLTLTVVGLPVLLLIRRMPADALESRNLNAS